MAPLFIYPEDLAYDFLAFDNKIPDVPYPSRRDLRDVDDSFLVFIFIKKGEHSIVMHL